MNAILAREIYFFDGKDLRYRKTRSNQVAGKVVGTTGVDGYRKCGHMGKQYKVHRIIWLYVYGEWPSGVIDHINGIRDDNRIENLRDASHSINSLNQRPRGNCPYVGVYFHKRAKKFQASLMTPNGRKYLGSFESAEDALAARTAAEINHFGQQYSNLLPQGAAE